MKISDLMNRLIEIRMEYGNLDIYLEVHLVEDKVEAYGELDSLYEEERTTLVLVCEEGEKYSK